MVQKDQVTLAMKVIPLSIPSLKVRTDKVMIGYEQRFIERQRGEILLGNEGWNGKTILLFRTKHYQNTIETL